MELRGKMTPVPEGVYLLGLSGGADSVLLLQILLPDVRDGRIGLEAVHVNHGIRGREADEDEHFCAELCRREKIPFQAFHADLTGRKDEAAAREARYAFFRELAAQRKADALLLAHNADDQAETFLMRLLRGAGPEGLGCMKTEEMNGRLRILRPMLTLRRGEIREALREAGISWREDSTNRNPDYLRNRVRMELIPLLEKFSPSAVGKIGSAAAMIAEDHRLLDSQAGALLQRLSRGPVLDAEKLAMEAVPLRKRVLRLWWKKNGPCLQEHTLNARQTEELAALLRQKKGKVNLPGDLHAVRAGRFLFLTGEREETPASVPVAEKETVFGAYRLTVGPSEGNPGDGMITQELPGPLLKGCVIRTRMPGDRITPFGSGGSRKLQDYLTDRKIPEPFRDRIPLLCKGGEVLMVCGTGTGNVPRWENEEEPVRLTWHGEMPWMDE